MVLEERVVTVIVKYFGTQHKAMLLLLENQEVTNNRVEASERAYANAFSIDKNNDVVMMEESPPLPVTIVKPDYFSRAGPGLVEQESW